MDYTATVVEAVGKAISDRDTTITCLKYDRDRLQKRIDELEAGIDELRTELNLRMRDG
jgi:peptidoglycan hydrolase CwlO-like protein